MNTNNTIDEDGLIYLIENGYIQQKDIYKFLTSKGEILLEEDPYFISFCWDYGELYLQLKGTLSIVRVEGSLIYGH